MFEGRKAAIIWLYDITKRVVVENRLERLMSAQSDWLWEIDENLRIVNFTENFHKRTGYTQKQIHGLPMEAFGKLVGADPKAFRSFLGDLKAHRPIRNVELERLDGDQHWVRLNAAPVWEGGVFTGYLGSTTDITELRRTQNRLVETERAAALGGMVAGVAHEINTPLGVSVTALSVLASEVEKIKSNFDEGKLSRNAFQEYLETGEEGFRMLRENLQRTSELVKNFKQVAVDQSSDAKREINLKHYIEQVVSNLEPRFKMLLHTVEVTGDEDIVVETYPGAIAQIVTNLIENSIVHAFDDDEAGKMKFFLAAKLDNVSSEEAQLVYTDNGRGMEPEVARRVFEPFFTTARGKGGSGLGMHIIQNLVTQQLNGLIDCNSRAGNGITVEISLPLSGPLSA
jgi:PAS domain S-box-containing protein